MVHRNKTIAAAVASIAAVLTTAHAHARPAEPLTKLEARTLPPAKLERRVLEQLGDVLTASPQPRTARPRRELADLWFWTRPLATYTPGLCKSSLVIMTFSPLEPIDRGAETPVKVTGISADVRFRFLTSQPSYLDRTTRANRLKATDAGCGRLNPDKETFIQADDEETFVNGFWLIRAAVEKVARNDTLPVGCNGERDPPEACRTLLVSFPMDMIGQIERCDAAREGAISTSCVSVSTGELEARLYWRYGSDQLTRVEMLEYLVLSHERVD